MLCLVSKSLIGLVSIEIWTRKARDIAQNVLTIVLAFKTLESVDMQNKTSQEGQAKPKGPHPL